MGLDQLAREIRARAAELTPACTSFLQDLIRIPATSGEEGARVERIRAEMASGGYDAVEIDGLGSVIGRVGSGRGPIVATDGHVDQVGVGDPTAWKVDPHAGVLKDGVVYGRGAVDQLGGVVASVYAGRLLASMDVAREFTLQVVGSVMEEDCDGLCWLYLAREHGLRPNVVVLTEPTSLRVHRGHRGRMEMKVTTRGRSCHASMPHLGENAIYKMAPVIREIEAMAGSLRDDAFLGKGTVAISRVESTSPSLNAVADTCTVYLDRRLTAGETRESSVREVASLPSCVAAGATVEVLEYEGRGYTGARYGQDKYFPTWVLEPDHPLVLAGVEAARLATEKEPEVSRWVFSTNGVATMGTLGIPSIGYGPGDERHAHTPDDQVRVRDLTAAIAFYALLPFVWSSRS